MAYNYTKVKKREKRMYAFSDISFGKTGVSKSFIIAFLLSFMIVLIIYYILATQFGLTWHNPLVDLVTSIYFYFIFIGIPFGLALILVSVKIQDYSLIEYLLAHIAPKKSYDQNGRVVEHSNYNVSTLFMNIFKEV